MAVASLLLGVALAGVSPASATHDGDRAKAASASPDARAAKQRWKAPNGP